MDEYTPGGSPIHWHHRRRLPPPKIACPLCGKKVSSAAIQALRDHIEAKHKEKS